MALPAARSPAIHWLIASINRRSRNRASRAARSMIVKRKFRVKGIVSLPVSSLGSSRLVRRPAGLGDPNISGLSFLGSAAEQDDQRLPFLSEVDSIPGAEVDLVLKDP